MQHNESGAETWVDFYLVVGPSAAVLLGLLFVALSINREATAAEAHLGGQARQAIFALVSVFVVSLLVLLPDQSREALGVELIVGVIPNLAISIARQMRILATTERSQRIAFGLRMAVYDAGLLLILAAGLGFVAGYGFGFHLLAAASIALTLLAIGNSWTLTFLGTERVGDWNRR